MAQTNSSISYNKLILRSIPYRMTPSIWPPKQLKIGKSCFLVARMIHSMKDGYIETATHRDPLPSKWEE